MVNLIWMGLDMSITCTAPTTFETQTCTRCGGSGRYSYNQMHGDRCYGCNGRGIAYTKRGAAAVAFLNGLRKIRLDQLQVGDFMQVSTMSATYFAPIVSIGPGYPVKSYNHNTGEWVEHSTLSVTTEHPSRGKSGLVASPSAIVRKGFSAKEKAEQIKQALAYQATLTKTGKPRKR